MNKPSSVNIVGIELDDGQRPFPVASTWSIEDARRMAPEAFRDALARYPADVEGALIFFGSILLGPSEPSAEDIAWAHEVMKRHGR